jgi:hypothetical protein
MRASLSKSWRVVGIFNVATMLVGTEAPESADSVVGGSELDVSGVVDEADPVVGSEAVGGAKVCWPTSLRAPPSEFADVRCVDPLEHAAKAKPTTKQPARARPRATLVP